MKAKLLILLLFAFVLVCFSFAVAQETRWGIPDEEEQIVEVKIDKTKVSPELRRILEAEEEAMNKIGELNEMMQGLDGDQVAELQKQVEQIKRNTEMEILKIRLEIARERNDAQNVQEIEVAIDQLENPPTVVEDQESKALREAIENKSKEE